MQLQYQAGTDENDNEIWENMGAPVTLPRTEGEGNEWEYTWENIPLYHPDDPSIETGETTYRVVELDGDGYVQVGGTEEGTARGIQHLHLHQQAGGGLYGYQAVEQRAGGGL